MRRSNLLRISIALTIAFVLSSNAERNAAALPRCFKFCGSMNIAEDLTNPDKWFEITRDTLSQEPNAIYVSGIRIKRYETYYIENSKLKVNTNEKLHNDILTAGGFADPKTVQPIFTGDYQIFVTAEKPACDN